MSTVALSSKRSRFQIRCHYRPVLLIGMAALLLCLFWFTSRYPQLLQKAAHVNKDVATMAYGKATFAVSATAPAWEQILIGALNWLDGMKIGMSFGILFGALLHTTLRYFPLKIGKNLYLNSLKGALIGAPMGVCANCAVPAACGITRGKGRIEVALGFLFSSPNFNPVVMFMTFTALPLAMGITKYAILLFTICVLVPGVIGWLEKRQGTALESPSKLTGINETWDFTLDTECTEKLGPVAKEVFTDFGKHVWGLFKPTVTTMVLASLVSSVLLVLVPWPTLLANTSPLTMLLMSRLATLMPVPIALDVMFANQLQRQGVDSGYVMMFLMTLGVYSILPSIYLWREVSKPLAVILFGFFVLIGWGLGLIFS
ncbi:permease [Armatimonas sp.]|uniref:permease n=1 Tax=Armatimonas sp. TaxID=1872638 RepID=UPI00286BB39A|nr:permease [Armatimonas sp.]